MELSTQVKLTWLLTRTPVKLVGVCGSVSGTLESFEEHPTIVKTISESSNLILDIFMVINIYCLIILIDLLEFSPLKFNIYKPLCNELKSNSFSSRTELKIPSLTFWPSVLIISYAPT